MFISLADNTSSSTDRRGPWLIQVDHANWKIWTASPSCQQLSIFNNQLSQANPKILLTQYWVSNTYQSFERVFEAGILISIADSFNCESSNLKTFTSKTLITYNTTAYHMYSRWRVNRGPFPVYLSDTWESIDTEDGKSVDIVVFGPLRNGKKDPNWYPVDYIIVPPSNYCGDLFDCYSRWLSSLFQPCYSLSYLSI